MQSECIGIRNYDEKQYLLELTVASCQFEHGTIIRRRNAIEAKFECSVARCDHWNLIMIHARMSASHAKLTRRKRLLLYVCTCISTYEFLLHISLLLRAELLSRCANFPSKDVWKKGRKIADISSRCFPQRIAWRGKFQTINHAFCPIFSSR